MKHAVLCVAAFAFGCSTPVAPPPSQSTGSTEPAPTSGTQETAAPIGSSVPNDARCSDPKGVEKIDVAQGATGKTPLGIAVTYAGLEHDSYEGGSSDTILNLTFQGILEDGRLTPSAFTWRPSALAPPSFAYLGGMPICVRISNPLPKMVTLELFRAPSR
ncbi:MAG: hypothetical protein HOV80_03705 [Polyangiaceae bacterium]|nr:hypothetical protein [Polyangiaceae bacterium]